MKENYKIKCFTYKEFENKREELVNNIFNICSSFSEIQSYSTNIADNVAQQKYEIYKELLNYFDKETDTFFCMLMLEDKPVTYAICDNFNENQWRIPRMITSKQYQNKKYTYITEKFCINKIALLEGELII